MTRVSVTIPGPPTPQKRHRHVVVGHSVRTYDPSAKDKAAFRAEVEARTAARLLEGPLAVRIECWFPRPASHLRKDGGLAKSAPIWHVQRPDADNLAKFALDALNGVLWLDDSQVVELTVSKDWTLLSSPHTHIKIDQLT